MIFLLRKTRNVNDNSAQFFDKLFGMMFCNILIKCTRHFSQQNNHKRFSCFTSHVFNPSCYFKIMK
jgi:hypothetical protein